MKPLIVTSGEPAGVGPDICLALADSNLPIVVIGDIDLLRSRALLLGKNITITEYKRGQIKNSFNSLCVLHVSCPELSKPGELNMNNAHYVVEMLRVAAQRTLESEFSAIVTAPAHKGIINAAGVNFSGHTEFFANYCGVRQVVMMLASSVMRVALLTTHIPLCNVASVISSELIMSTVRIINQSLQQNYAIKTPKIYVAGLNPHAGENGYIGREEVEIISPALEYLRMEGIDVIGPLSADTMFSQDNIAAADVFLTMYHDQGLPVLKSSGFHDSVNITLGLPIIRTSVDHGTALNLAGSGKVNTSSLFKAVDEAISMAKMSS